MKRQIVPPAVFLIAGVIALWGASALASVAVRTQTVQKRKLTRIVIAYGQLVPDPHTLEWLTSGQAGRISAVLATSGTRVHKGQVLARIEPTPKTRATFENAKSALASARAKFRQVQTLEKNGLATHSDLESARSALASAKARLAALKAEGVSAHAYAMQAHTAGVITQLAISRGQWVKAGEKVAALAPAGTVWIRLGIPPNQAIHVKVGDAVRLSSVFGSAKTQVSKVAQVSAQANAATGLIDIEVPVHTTSHGALLGEWMTGAITLGSVTMPAVPRSAVLMDASGSYVYVVHKGKASRVSVTPVIRAQGLVGLRGVKVGQRVVTQGNFELHNGQAVRESAK